MISSRRSVDANELSPDLTPLLDIIFIVMVFLLLSANIQIQTLNVAIPQSDSKEELSTASDPNITISIPANGDTWGLQNTSYASWNDFKQAFESSVSDTNKPVIIASDREANVEKLLKLFQFLQSKKIQATNVIMENET